MKYILIDSKTGKAVKVEAEELYQWILEAIRTVLQEKLSKGKVVKPPK